MMNTSMVDMFIKMVHITHLYRNLRYYDIYVSISPYSVESYVV